MEGCLMPQMWVSGADPGFPVGGMDPFWGDVDL